MRRRTYLTSVAVGGIAVTAGCLDDKTGFWGNEYNAEVRNKYIGVAEESATEIDNWYGERGDTTLQLSESTELESGEIMTAQRWIDKEIVQFPEDVEDLHYVDLETGVVLATSRPQLQPLEVRAGEFDFTILPSNEAPWITEDVDFGADELYVSEPIYALLQSNIYFVTPVDTERDGDTVLVMQMNFDAMVENLDTEMEGQFTQIVDDRGRIVGRTDEKTVLEWGPADLPHYNDGNRPDFIERGLQGESGFVDSFDQGGKLDESHIVAFAPVPGRDSVVATHVPESSI